MSAKTLLKQQSAGGKHDIEDWVTGQLPEYQRRVDKLELWLKDEDSGHNSVRDRVAFLGRMHLHNYVVAGLDGRVDLESLALSTRLYQSEFIYCIRVHERFPKNIQMVRMNTMPEALGQLITTGWKDRAELFSRLALKHYPNLFNDGVASGKLPYFLFDLINDWLGTNVVVDGRFRQSGLYASNITPEMAIWDELLAGWREPNPERFDALLSKAADYHVSQSVYRPNSERHYEVTEVGHWLFPVELLAVLRLREWEGIETSNPSHELFNITPLGSLPNPIPNWPHDEFYDAVEAKYKTILPELPPLPTLDDLPALRAEQTG